MFRISIWGAEPTTSPVAMGLSTIIQATDIFLTLNTYFYSSKILRIFYLPIQHSFLLFITEK